MIQCKNKDALLVTDLLGGAVLLKSFGLSCSTVFIGSTDIYRIIATETAVSCVHISTQNTCTHKKKNQYSPKLTHIIYSSKQNLAIPNISTNAKSDSKSLKLISASDLNKFGRGFI